MTRQQHGKIILNAVIVILAATLIYLNLPKSDANAAKVASKPLTVDIQIIAISDIADRLEAIATAKAKESITLSSATSDYVSAIHFDDGQQVNQGQLLVQLNDEEEQAKIGQLSVALKEQQRQLARLQNLASTQATAKSQLEQQQALVDESIKQLEVEQIRLAQLAIKAPFSGVVGLRQVSPGSYVTPGTLLTTLDDISQIRVEFSLPEQHLSKLKIGLPVTVYSQAFAQQKFHGQLDSIDSRINATTRTITVRALIDNPDRLLRPGMLLNTTISQNLRQGILIPESAVISHANVHEVYIRDEQGLAQKVEVKLGQRLAGKVEVLSGLSVGQSLIRTGIIRLRPGLTVTPRTEG